MRWNPENSSIWILSTQGHCVILSTMGLSHLLSLWQNCYSARLCCFYSVWKFNLIYIHKSFSFLPHLKSKKSLSMNIHFSDYCEIRKGEAVVLLVYSRLQQWFSKWGPRNRSISITITWEVNTKANWSRNSFWGGDQLSGLKQTLQGILKNPWSRMMFQELC